jgi:hypothetical protein
MTKRIKKRMLILTLIWTAPMVALAALAGSSDFSDVIAGPFWRETSGSMRWPIELLIVGFVRGSGALLAIFWGVYFLRWTWAVTKPGRKEEDR